ncbi:MAG: hypothetical protein E7252_08770 [Lachnospira sp.]|nr:hypothetical protein [Lachnospira sp.]
MPQINRIRVNNVKYNFGTQFYDDFVMRFSCKNTIYDLANGGGKSVLMLLLLQNLIPNCTLDEKQPIEKLFRTGSGSSTIHSLIEWKLDSCYIKDNYKYMTTGFCARKAKDSGSENDAKDTANIEYFNYCIFYRSFGDNDIKNLPLSNGEERITYNGLKAYLRDLEKNDLNVSVKIFERKGDYQKFLTEYGIFESEWEIVRGINKTEGHVRTYFETNYKTGRKVVEDLLIEEIIQKSFTNRIGGTDDEGTMAKTLLDIKDKLIELSKKKSVISDYDKQIKAMEDFSQTLDSFNEMFVKKETLKSRLINNYIAACGVLKKNDAKLLELEEERNTLAQDQLAKQRVIAAAKVKEDKDNLDKLKNYIEVCYSKKDKLDKDNQTIKQELLLKEIANQYADYMDYQNKRDEVKAIVDNRLRDFKDIKNELAQLASAKKALNDKLISDATKDLEDLTKKYEKIHAKLNELKKDDVAFEKSIAILEAKEEDLQLLVTELEAKLPDMLGQQMAISMDYSKELMELCDMEAELMDELNVLKNRYENAKAEVADLQKEMLENGCNMRLYKEQLEAVKASRGESKEVSNRLSKVYDVYKDKDNLEMLYKKALKDVTDKEMSLKRLTEYKESLERGLYPLEGEDYLRLKNYLEETYGQEVLTGDEWLKTLPITVRRDVIKRIPFIMYSFVVLEDFERIKTDVVIPTLNRGSYAVPIIGEGILRETRHAVNSDYVIFGMKDLSFLHDEARLEKELKLATEELDALEDEFTKEKSKYEVIEKDYQFVLLYNNSHEENESRLSEQEEQYTSKYNEALSIASLLEEKLNSKETLLKNIYDKINNLSGDLAEVTKDKDIYKNIIELNAELDKKYANMQAIKASKQETNAKLAVIKADIENVSKEESSIKQEVIALEERLDAINKEWALVYASYYDENTEFEAMDEVDDSKFKGLKSIIEGEAKDVNDKLALIENYEASMNKVLRDIEYRGFKFDELKEKYEADELKPIAISELVLIKKQINALEKEISDMSSEIDAQNALMNRLEGSISHAINNYNEKYGEYEDVNLDNPKRYIEENTQLLKGIEAKLKEMSLAIKNIESAKAEAGIVKKDLERILVNSDITVPDVSSISEEYILDSYDNYEDNQKEFALLIKQEYKKKDSFEKDKLRLKDVLMSVGGFELANEISTSISLPKNSAEISELKENIKATNECIALERDRIVKSIEDMEKIKDNFENRCIQTCTNIKSELDRLPKLSKITMDNEVISIIGLQIPYVKEEMFKDRMSAYINETVTGAESFKDADERLKYIRNRLAWKKLFSVIVSDMNAIRLNLYKRERIKDQSRYLRYEEAVGSTGQSQGIYIQFLIAIINYISNINALAKTEGLVGKVIFIDNPFGAAKDIYIWEPIFKLLKTNHVQLIVPARGATPAITGRFDVNYILGQKLVDGKQQTVVVDYRSQVQNEEIEYTKLDFEQTSFDI